MKKIFTLAFAFTLISAFNVFAQTKTDSLKRSLSKAASDNARVALLVELSKNYYLLKPDSGLYYADKALTIAKKTGDINGEMRALSQAGFSMFLLGNYPAALQTFLHSQHIANQLDDKWSIARNYDGIGCVYARENDNKLAVEYILKSEAIFRQIGDYNNVVDELMGLGHFYRDMGRSDLGLQYSKQALSLSIKINETKWRPQILSIIGVIYAGINQYDLAINYLHQSIALAKKDGQMFNLILNYRDIAKIYQKSNQRDSTIFYAKKGFQMAKKASFSFLLSELADLLAQTYYGSDDHNSALYYNIATTIKDSLFTAQKAKEVMIINITEQQHVADLKNASLAFKNNLKLYGLLVVLALVVIILLMVWINNKKKQRANVLLANQKQQIQQTLQELKQTQSQLIQSEKMASLGELTAGIAHEIQNPLNFVNNFSEVNREMVEELEEELKKGNIGEALAIAADIKGNEEKINHHGKRAGSIVKGMLEHSRTSTGERQPTNINVLVDEFLKLSYHGLRAKDKDFNAELLTSYDESLPIVNVVQQDIGRVLLNLFNNAFYAVNQKKKTAGADYKANVTVSTSSGESQIIIKVKDNGMGVPDAIKDKIMQPFFTTKPTGEGTGLGLSLSYDIVVKGHGGSITVDSREGDGTTCTIILPTN